MYFVRVIKNGLLYDRAAFLADELSISAYIQSMLSYGYGLDIEYVPVISLGELVVDAE